MNNLLQRRTQKPYGYWKDETIISELKKIIEELNHFPKKEELIKKQDLVGAMDRHGGIEKFRELFGYELLQKPNGYWTDEVIIGELKKIEVKIKHFPKYKELNNRQDLLNAIDRHQGLNKFRVLCGHELLKKPVRYWTDETIINELKEIEAELKHFPKKEELIALGKRGLSRAMDKNGGFTKFREQFGYKLLKKPAGYWTDEIIINELKRIEAELKHFPIRAELNNRQDLAGAINTHGGIVKFRKLLGHEPLTKPAGYWTDEIIINELKRIEAELKHFPTNAELKGIERMGLVAAMMERGGSNKFRELLGRNLLKKPDGYWVDKIIISELKRIEAELKHFPTQAELNNKQDLLAAISVHGGLSKFREMFGYEPLKKPDGYWTDEIIINELKRIEAELKHFPTHTELNNKQGLIGGIKKQGGIGKFREAMGYSTSVFEQYLKESAKYCGNRGRKTEHIVKNILVGWCKQNGYPEPTYNQKLAINNVIEFVCNTGKIIGVDVTNTKSKFGDAIRRKYRKKDYHKYVDELWIVVFSNVFEEKDYRKFNEESPDNVKVMSIDTFLEELDISTDEHLHSKIENYKNCTFRTKDEFVKRHQNKSLKEYGM